MKKITLLLVCFISFTSLMNAQNSFMGNTQGTPPAIDMADLLERYSTIGNQTGSLNDHFSIAEQRLLNAHFNDVQNRAPVVITQSNSQTIEAGTEIACATPTSFRNNNMFRHFDLPGDFSITNGLTVNAVEFAIGTISTPAGFPITANIYSTTPDSFPGGTLTLQGTAVYNATNADAATMINLPLSATIPAGEAMVMELVIVDDFTDTNFMRFGCNNGGETGPSYIQAVDCGAVTPTPFSDLGLTQGLVWNVLGDDEVGGGGPVVVYGINNSNIELISFDPTDPATTTVIGPSPVTVNFENAGSIDPNDLNTAYVLDNAGVFYSVNVTTGAYTNLGNIPGGWTGAEFDPSTGILYAIDLNTLSLFTIDIAGVSSTLVGPSPAGTLPIALAIDDAGNAYSYDVADDTLYSVDLATGATTPIGFIGFDANFGQGMCWDASTDTFYMSAFNSTAFAAEWRTVDVATGNTTLVGPIVTTASPTQVAWSSIPGQIIASVVENALEGFVIYPNPSSEIINLKSVNTIETVAIFNILGQKIMDMNVNALTSEINVSSFNTGTYIMKVTVYGQTGTYKILKK